MLQDINLQPLGEDKIEHAVIMLHGLGDNSSGIMGLGEAFRTAMQGTLFLAPNAPFTCPHVPGGYQWFGSENWTPDIILKGVKTAAPILDEYIDHVLEKTNLSPDKVALVGFSQGTMMGLYVAPRREKQMAGILGYSGALFGGKELKAEKKSSPPVSLIHGTDDDVVPFSSMNHAQTELKECEIPVQSTPCQGLTHGVDDKGLRKGVAFLREVFKIS